MEGTLVSIGRRVSLAFTNLGDCLRDSLDTLNDAIENESQRFQLWAMNLGLYHSGHSSLGYKFRDAPLLYDFARKSLRDLEEYLHIGKVASVVY